MANETKRKVGSIVLGLMVVGMVGFIPAGAADTGPSPSESSTGHCVTVDPTGPGVMIDPESCKRVVAENLTVPPATP